MEKLINSFLEYLKKEKNYSLNTVFSYEDDLKQLHQFLMNHFSNKNYSLKNIDGLTIRLFLGELLESGISKKSIARKLSAIKSFFKYIYKIKVMDINPARNIATPKLPKKLPAYLDENAIIKMMELPDNNTIEGLRDRALLELLYSTGIRLSELIQLTLDSLDLNNQTIKVLGKGNKQRIVPFGSKAKEALQKYMARRLELLSRTQVDAKSVLFLSNTGLKMYPKAVYNIVKKYIEKVSEIERKSPHIIRHTFATHMLNRGADLKAVKELLGHVNLSTTQIYTHVTIEHLKRVYNQSHPKS